MTKSKLRALKLSLLAILAVGPGLIADVSLAPVSTSCEQIQPLSKELKKALTSAVVEHNEGLERANEPFLKYFSGLSELPFSTTDASELFEASDRFDEAAKNITRALVKMDKVFGESSKLESAMGRLKIDGAIKEVAELRREVVRQINDASSCKPKSKKYLMCMGVSLSQIYMRKTETDEIEYPARERLKALSKTIERVIHDSNELACPQVAEEAEPAPKPSTTEDCPNC